MAKIDASALEEARQRLQPLDNSEDDTLEALSDGADEKVEDDDKDDKDDVDDDIDDSDDKADTDDELEDDEKEDDEKEEDDKEDKEEDEDEEEVEEDKLYLDNVPKRKEILKKYPNLYKDFPGLEKALYREQQYAEVFPTLSDAKAAVENLGIFREIDSSIRKGDLEFIMSAAQRAGSLGNMANSALTTLEKLDKPAYSNIISKVVKAAIIDAYESGKSNNNDQLQIAAQWLHKYVYGDHKITPFEESKPDARVENAPINNAGHSEYMRNMLVSSVKDVNTRINNVVKSYVERNIDPKEQMSGYVRSKAVNDVMNRINEAIKSDRRFASVIDSHWRETIANNFSEIGKLKVRNAFIGKSKSVAKNIIRQVRIEALKGSEKRRKKDSDKSVYKRDKDSNNRGGRRGEMPPPGMSTLDFLSQD